MIVEGMTTVNIPSLHGASFIFADPTTIDPNRWAGATIDGTIANDLMNGAFRDVDGQGISGGGQTILGGFGNETIFDGAGNDHIFGGDGVDLFYNGAGADTIDGGAGRDTLSYAYANGGVLFNMLNQTANAGMALGDRATNIEVLHGSDFSDVIFGGASTALYGRAGDDYIRDGLGTQQLFGGAGLDTFAMGAADRSADKVMDFVIGQDKIDLTAWMVTSFSQLTISARQTVTGNGAIRNDVLITFGRETVVLDGLTATDRGNLTAASFVLNTPVPLAGMRMAQPDDGVSDASPRSLARVVGASTAGTAQASLAATMALAASPMGQDQMAFQSVPGTGLNIGSYAALSSTIAGDALAGRASDAGGLATAGSAGALIDPQTTITAFLSATQLAALDDNQFSFY